MHDWRSTLAMWAIGLGLPLSAIWLLPSPDALGHWSIWVALFLLVCAISLGAMKMVDNVTRRPKDGQ